MHAEEAGRPRLVAERRIGEGLDVPGKHLDCSLIVTAGVIRLPEVEMYIRLERRLLTGRGQRQGTLPSRDGLVGVAAEQTMGAQKGRKPAQPQRIVEVFGQGFRFT